MVPVQEHLTVMNKNLLLILEEQRRIVALLEFLVRLQQQR